MVTRRTLLRAVGAGAAGLAVAGVGVGTAAAVLPGAAGAVLPSVDMEALVKAAQIDPRRPDQVVTPGSKPSVLLVEQALQAKGLLASTYVDGSYGTKTIDAYAAFQRSLGYTGLSATGFPGQTSLTKLGSGRFTVARPITLGGITTFRGVKLDGRTIAMLQAAEGLLGRTLTLSQGSYNPGGDSSSAGTHDGGGVMDVSVAGMTASYRVTVALKLRTVGFAAWVRNPSQGDWPYHIHANALGDTDQSSAAQHQCGDYYLGMNGLANRAPDDGPTVSPIVTWEEFQRASAG